MVTVGLFVAGQVLTGRNLGILNFGEVTSGNHSVDHFLYGDHGRTYGAGMDDLAIADRENFPPEPHHAQGTAIGSFYFSYHH